MQIVPIMRGGKRKRKYSNWERQNIEWFRVWSKRRRRRLNNK
jgi:hypothetical protein